MTLTIVGTGDRINFFNEKPKNTGYQINGIDIAANCIAYYESYNSATNINSVATIPNWANKIRFLLIGSGGQGYGTVTVDQQNLSSAQINQGTYIYNVTFNSAPSSGSTTGTSSINMYPKTIHATYQWGSGSGTVRETLDTSINQGFISPVSSTELNYFNFKYGIGGAAGKETSVAYIVNSFVKNLSVINFNVTSSIASSYTYMKNVNFELQFNTETVHNEIRTGGGGGGGGALIYLSDSTNMIRPQGIQLNYGGSDSSTNIQLQQGTNITQYTANPGNTSTSINAGTGGQSPYTATGIHCFPGNAGNAGTTSARGLGGTNGKTFPYFGMGGQGINPDGTYGDLTYYNYGTEGYVRIYYLTS
jgi:hypothetical protein